MKTYPVKIIEPSILLQTNLTVPMVATITTNIRKAPVVHTGLQDLVSHLSNPFVCRAGNNNSFFINEIPAAMQLETDTSVFASVFTGLLDAVFAYTKDSSIRMTAAGYGNVIFLKIKDSNNPHIECMDTEMKKLKPVADMMNASLNVTIKNRKFMTITFGFPNLPINY
ncbi:MAG: hypothetical protein ACXWV1_12920 [Chitinophagaceae bacterium]